VLLNNAAIGVTGKSWEGLDNWKSIMDVNLFGYVFSSMAAMPSTIRLHSVINVQHTFVPSMIHQENPSAIVNTGSKQGITNPP